MASRIWFSIALAILGLSSPSGAAASIIRGTIHVPASGANASAPLNPYPGRANSLPAPASPPRGAVTDAVIYVDGSIPDSAVAPANRPARLAQKGQAFQPRVLPIAVGGAVDFLNVDPIYHNVFSVSPTKRFDLGKYSKGKSKRVVFEKQGLVNIYCDIHSGMEAFILVLPNAWFTRPEPSGSFSLPPLAAGSYRIKVWHPDFGKREITVDLADGEDRTVEISY
jgi:plastocyanin